MSDKKLEITMRGDMDSASLVAKLIAQAVNGDLTGGTPLFMGYNINYTGMTVCPRIDLERRTGQDLEDEHEIIKRRLNALRAANDLSALDVGASGITYGETNVPIHVRVAAMINKLRGPNGLEPVAISAHGDVRPAPLGRKVTPTTFELLSEVLEANGQGALSVGDGGSWEVVAGKTGPEILYRRGAAAPAEVRTAKNPLGKLRKGVREVLGHVVEIHKGIKELLHLARQAEERRKSPLITVTAEQVVEMVDPLHGMEVELQVDTGRHRAPRYHFHYKGQVFKADTGDALANRREALRQAALTPGCPSEALEQLVASIREEEARRALPKGSQ